MMAAANTAPQAPKRTPGTPTSEEFSRTLGQVTWLMGLSDAHKDLPVRALEGRVQTPLMFKQVRVFTKGKQPIAAVIWASVSNEIEAALEHPDFVMDLNHWRSGENLVIVDIVSPFVERAKIEILFWEQVKQAQGSDQPPAAPKTEGEQ